MAKKRKAPSRIFREVIVDGDPEEDPLEQYRRPFKQFLYKLQEETAKQICGLLSPDDQAWDEECDAAPIVGSEDWHICLSDLWCTARHLEKAILANDTNMALNLAYILGQCYVDKMYREHFSEAICAHRKQKAMLQNARKSSTFDASNRASSLRRQFEDFVSKSNGNRSLTDLRREFANSNHVSYSTVYRATKKMRKPKK